MSFMSNSKVISEIRMGVEPCSGKLIQGRMEQVMSKIESEHDGDEAFKRFALDFHAPVCPSIHLHYCTGGMISKVLMLPILTLMMLFGLYMC